MESAPSRARAVAWSLIGYYAAEAVPLLHLHPPRSWHWPLTGPLAVTVIAALLGA